MIKGETLIWLGKRAVETCYYRLPPTCRPRTLPGSMSGTGGGRLQQVLVNAAQKRTDLFSIRETYF